MQWHGYDYLVFTENLGKNIHDLAVIGGCLDETLKLDVTGTDKPVICYQSSALSGRKQIDSHENAGKSQNPLEIFETIRIKPVGTPLCPPVMVYSGFNNRLWAYQAYEGADILEKEENILFCNGWVLPQQLLREKLLEV